MFHMPSTFFMLDFKTMCLKICVLFSQFHREETEIIEGEVVEIQIDRPATGTVSTGTRFKSSYMHTPIIFN
mgnify:CR=1 FL=1